MTRMDTAGLLLTALLALYRPPADIRRCIDHRRESIVAQATQAADRHHVPVAILLVTAFLETHIGCDRGEGGGWGAPLHASTPHLAGNADTSASALALGFTNCHTWLRAVHYYRVGRCNGPEHVGYTAETALRIVERVHQRVAAALPVDFRVREYARGSPAP